MMETLNYLIFSISFPYTEKVDDVLDQMIQERLEYIYLGLEFINSQIISGEKTSKYSIKFKESDAYIIDDVVYELFISPLFTHTVIEWTIMDEETAEQEGFSF